MKLLRRLAPLFLVATTLGVVSSGSSRARASNQYLEIPPAAEAMRSRAYRYANFTNAEAYRELRRRGVPFVKTTAPLPGVRAPIRLTGPIRGVHVHSALPKEQRAKSHFEILDARLGVALDDFCQVLAQHDVVEVVHFTMYRPSGHKPADPKSAQTRHPGGMAIDVGALKKRNGLWLSVGSHWPPAIGAKTCGDGMRRIKNRRGRELRSILCELADQRIFHYMLSPHFDVPHYDHWHLEIKPEVKWFLVN